MPKLTDWELWAIAAKVVAAESDNIGEFLVERIHSLKEAGNYDGVKTWLAVAHRVQQLLMDRPRDPKEVN